MTTTTNRPAAMTPAEHRSRAESILDRLSQVSPGTSLYSNLAMTGIIHVLVAVAACLEPPPPVPGMPPGWSVEVRQAGNASRKWRYELAGPGRAGLVSRYLWDSPETAAFAGVRYAIDHADSGTEA